MDKKNDISERRFLPAQRSGFSFSVCNGNYTVKICNCTVKKCNCTVKSVT